jgi:Rieske Fe-S protein
MTALKNLAEYIPPGEISSVDELRPGEGAILRHGLRKLTAYRDREGRARVHSAACTHLGCHLHWNSFETCRDCPAMVRFLTLMVSRYTHWPFPRSKNYCCEACGTPMNLVR